MNNSFSFIEMQARNAMIFGDSDLRTLHQATVFVAGVGGVGGFAIEVLVRMGIKRLIIVDGDSINTSNLNRQIISNSQNIGTPKVQAMRERAMLINPSVEIIAIHDVLHKDSMDEILQMFTLDLILDAIDSVGSKAQLIAYAKRHDIPIVTALGAAQRSDPTQFMVLDLFETHGDPLARALRTALKKMGIKKGVPSIFNFEQPIKRDTDVSSQQGSKVLGSYISVVMVAGSLLADTGIKLLLKKDNVCKKNFKN